MNRSLRIASAVVVVAAVFLAWSEVLADSGSVYTVSDVQVDVTADAAAVARSLALADGQRAALKRLLNRITLRGDYDRHPPSNDTEVSMMVQDIRISDERLSSIRYIANLTVRFKKEEIRKLLNRAGIPHTETLSKPLLVLPVYEIGGALILWDESNPWRQAWLSYAPTGDHLVPLVLPLGDLSDVASIGAKQALMGDRDRLRAITQRYGVKDALIAHAALVINLTNDVPRLYIDIQRFGPSGESSHVESILGDTRDDIDALLFSGVRQVRERIEERWKLDTLLSLGKSQRLSVRIPLKHLRDWLDVRKRLKETGNVSGISLVAISRSDARVIIDYVGGEQQLVLSLAQRDLDLQKEADFWIMRLRINGTVIRE